MKLHRPHVARSAEVTRVFIKVQTSPFDHQAEIIRSVGVLPLVNRNGPLVPRRLRLFAKITYVNPVHC